jgi:hypothetical protein
LLWNSHLGACSYWGTFQWFLWQMSDGLEITWKILTAHNWQIRVSSIQLLSHTAAVIQLLRSQHIMESHWHRALFLAAGTVAIHWRARSGLNVINYVRNFRHTCSHEKKRDRCHCLMNQTLTHSSPSSCNCSMVEWYHCEMTVSTSSWNNLMKSHCDQGSLMEGCPRIRE